MLDGAIDPLRANGVDDNPIYDVQARAIMHGHLWLPNGRIGAEAFAAHGHEYTYFGIFPSLLRIPIFVFTSSLDGRLFGLSTLAAWVVTAAFCSMLLWRLRVFLRGDVVLGWLEAASYGVLIASILIGSVLVFLASRPDAFNEDEAWSVALACGTLFALVGVVERPTSRRVVACGILVLLTNLNRSTTGYAAILATLLVAAWFGLGRSGQQRRSWAGPMVGAALVPLAVGCAIDLAKFGVPFGVPFADQLIYQAFQLQRINGGHYFSLHWLPSTLQQYVNPANFRVISVFPYIVLPDAPSHLFGGDPMANVPLSMPLLFASGVWGVVTAFTPGRPEQYGALRLLLIASAATAAVVMFYGWIYERFIADFMPLLILAGMIGLVDLWRRLDGSPRHRRVWLTGVVAVLGLFGVWANMGFALTPDTYWNSTQARGYVDLQRMFSDVTGHPLDGKVVTGTRPPSPAAFGTVFVLDHCRGLYLAFQTVLPDTTHQPYLFYLPVERAPMTSLCRSLANRR